MADARVMLFNDLVTVYVCSITNTKDSQTYGGARVKVLCVGDAEPSILSL